MIIKTRLIYFSLFIFFIYSSCNSGSYYKCGKELSSHWDKDNVVTFDIPVKSKNQKFNIFMILRNNNEYPYSNIYFFTELISPKGQKMKDTLEYQLAYPNGEWIGDGMGDIKENTLVYKENIQLKDTGKYQLRIKQAMRDNSLIGIEDIGLIVEKEK